MDYSQLAPTLKTGDVLLFHGSQWQSQVIEDVSDSHWSHMGMVFKDDGPTLADSLWIWQSFEPEGGVVIDRLRSFLIRYHREDSDNDYAARRLSVDRTPAMEQALTAFMKEVLGRPFPSIEQIIAHYLEGLAGVDSGLEEIFCSQLISKSYMLMGLLPDAPKPPNAYTPENFSAKDDRLGLLRGATLGPEIPITPPGAKAPTPTAPAPSSHAGGA